MAPLQFHCPACDQRLTVPASAAGQRGPCPTCGEEIIGPQPDLGIPARLPKPAAQPIQQIPFPPPQEPEPIEPESHPESPEVHEALEAFMPKDTEDLIEEPEVEETVAPPEEEPESPSVAPPPPADTDEPHRRIRRLWAAVFILSCVLCIVLAFIGGYLTALKRIQIDGPIFAPPAPVTSSAPPVTSTLPSPPPPIDATKEPDLGLGEDAPPNDPPETPDSRATLEAFLSAPDWEARAAYVADHYRVSMNASVEDNGEGPIETTSIEASLLDGDLHHYQVATPRIPDGFPVTLRRGNEGWLVHWPTFHEFSTDRFGRFVAGELGDSGEFRLFLKPTEDPQPAFAAYQLTSPVQGHSTVAYAARSGDSHAKLTSLLDSEQFRNDPRYQELMQRDGLPVTLVLQRKTSSSGQTYHQLGKVSAIGWGGN